VTFVKFVRYYKGRVYARSFCTWGHNCSRLGWLYWITTQQHLTVCRMYVCRKHIADVEAQGLLVVRVEE
jgi:hypothetical protein